MGFTGLANFPVMYQFAQGIHVPFWAFGKHPLESATAGCAMEKCRKNPTDKCYACKMSPMCKDHAARLRPACETLQPRQAQQAEHDTLKPDEQMRLDCMTTCYMPVDTMVSYPLLHPMPDQSPLRFA